MYLQAGSKSDRERWTWLEEEARPAPGEVRDSLMARSVMTALHEEM